MSCEINLERKEKKDFVCTFNFFFRTGIKDRENEKKTEDIRVRSLDKSRQNKESKCIPLSRRSVDYSY